MFLVLKKLGMLCVYIREHVVNVGAKMKKSIFLLFFAILRLQGGVCVGGREALRYQIFLKNCDFRKEFVWDDQTFLGTKQP